MEKYLWVIACAIAVLVSGCAVTATKQFDKYGNTVGLKLEGYGAEYAKTPDGWEVGKRETIRIPDITPDMVRK